MKILALLLLTFSLYASDCRQTIIDNGFEPALASVTVGNISYFVAASTAMATDYTQTTLYCEADDTQYQSYNGFACYFKDPNLIPPRNYVTFDEYRDGCIISFADATANEELVDTDGDGIPDTAMQKCAPDERRNSDNACVSCPSGQVYNENNECVIDVVQPSGDSSNDPYNESECNAQHDVISAYCSQQGGVLSVWNCVNAGNYSWDCDYGDLATATDTNNPDYNETIATYNPDTNTTEVATVTHTEQNGTATTVKQNPDGTTVTTVVVGGQKTDYSNVLNSINEGVHDAKDSIISGNIQNAHNLNKIDESIKNLTNVMDSNDTFTPPAEANTSIFDTISNDLTTITDTYTNTLASVQTLFTFDKTCSTGCDEVSATLDYLGHSVTLNYGKHFGFFAPLFIFFIKIIALLLAVKIYFTAYRVFMVARS